MIEKFAKLHFPNVSLKLYFDFHWKQPPWWIV